MEDDHTERMTSVTNVAPCQPRLLPAEGEGAGTGYPVTRANLGEWAVM